MATSTKKASVEVVMNIAAATSPRFSSDGSHFVADVGLLEKGRSLVLDGREIFHGTQHIIHYAIAPGGASVSFLSTEVLPHEEQKRTGKGSRVILVHGGKTTELDGNGEPSGLAVTPDGAHIAYSLSFSLKDASATFVDGKRFAGGIEPRLLTLSNDGKRWAMAHSVDRHGNGETVTVDGVKGPRHGAIWGLTFSPDGKHVAYKAVKLKGEGATLVVDGQISPRYTDVDDTIGFTADGRVVAPARRQTGAVVVVGTTDHAVGRAREWIIAGNTVAWLDEAAEKDRRIARAVVDGVEVYREDAGLFNRMADHGPSISGLVVAPSGKRIAFWTQKGVHVVDVGQGDRIVAAAGSPLAFDAAAHRLAVEIHANGNTGVDVLTVDGAPAVTAGPHFASPWQLFAETVRFRDGGLHFFGKRGNDLVRVKVPD